MSILSNIKTLLAKILTVKGVFFFTVTTLCILGKLDSYYVFIAGCIWVGAREVYKNISITKTPTLPSIPPEDDPRR